MKIIIINMAIAAILFTACNSGNNKATDSQISGKDTVQDKTQTDTAIVTSPVAGPKATGSIQEIITSYIQLKNAFAKDNSTDAARAGSSLEAGFKNIDKTALAAPQKKTFEDVEADAREHAEHIGKNGGNIVHQREHFEMLSKDIYDLVKAFGGGQVLYKDFCPMYNNGKGAFWISETREITNPYWGKAMPTCGIVKEEIK